MEAQNGGGTPVILNVYDLTPINNYLYWFGLGIFHSGIEVHGLEYGFGAHDLPVSGVFEVEPKSCPGYVYRRSVWMGTTAMSRAEFRSFVQTLAGEYSGNTYHLISKNCNHFTDDVCKNITKKSAPGWVNRLARVGSFFNRLLPKSVQVSTVSHGATYPAFSVHGLEYGFGAHDLPVSGVFEVEPKSCPGYVYRRSIWMGTTAMSRAEFCSFVQTLAGEYSGNTYHLISKNCNHFTDDVCKNITKKSAPGWVNRLARVGSFFNRLLPKNIQVSTVSHGATYPAFSDDDMDSVSSSIIGDSDVDELDQHLLLPAVVDLHSIDVSSRMSKDLP